MNKQLLFLAFTIISFVLFLAGCGSAVHLTNSPFVPGATGEVKLGTDDNNNTTVEIKVQHLAKPEQLTPKKSVYVVWIEGYEQKPVNAGQLVVDDDLEGTFTTQTPYQYFKMFITAEEIPTVSEPGMYVVLTTDLLRP
jgi:hypothetical protein